MKRREFSKMAATGLLGLGLSPNILAGAGITSTNNLKVAARRFETEVKEGTATHGATGAMVETVAGPLKTIVLLLEYNESRICLIASDFRVEMMNISRFLRSEVAAILKLKATEVLLFSSHNHSVTYLSEEEVRDFHWYGRSINELPRVNLLPVGERFVDSLRKNIMELPDSLEPATVHWSEGYEGRITYNRKGRRADGSTYFMREEDRRLVGKDFNGDIDREVPVVVFKGKNGNPIAAILQFTGHPVTSYHPEKFTIFGDYPAIAADKLGKALGKNGRIVPVAFLQGCAGDINSKEMFEGGVHRAREFGEMLGQSAVNALDHLKTSDSDGLNYVIETVSIPLAPLPSRKTILAEIAEMEDFVRRAEAGDEDTLFCVGLNFPRALSPRYRSALINIPLSWNKWALDIYEQGKEQTVMRTLDVPIYILRIGEVAIIGMPFEPFMGIGRQMREKSPFPLTIPCGYVNGTHGYVTDSANTGDREYMSSQYRYTRFRPPFSKPAGDVVADKAVQILLTMK